MLNMRIEVRVGFFFSLMVRVWVRLWFKVLRGVRVRVRLGLFCRKRVRVRVRVRLHLITAGVGMLQTDRFYIFRKLLEHLIRPPPH